MEKKVAYAHTQNCDMLGTCALDWAGVGFANLCRAKGIDTDRYHLVALNVWGLPVSQCSIIAVDTSIAGKTFEEVSAYAKEHSGSVPAVDFHFFTTPKEIGTYVKEFSAELVQRDIGIQKVEITERVDLE